MGDGYPIPLAEGRVELVFKNSRFIGLLAPAPSVGEAKEYLGGCRRQWPDASHHVYAYAVGHGASVVHGMSDDGEPSGTAGRPVLAVLRGSGLGDAIVVAVRYFGGTKLGTGGLVKAYTETAQAVLAAGEIGRKIDTLAFSVEWPYEIHRQAKLLLETHQAEIESEEFGAQVRLRLRLPRTQAQPLDRALGELSGGRLGLKEQG